MPGTLFVVATPIGNLEDITTRALRVLRSVALIAAEDTRRTAKLLAHYAITTPTTSLHTHNEAAKVPDVISRLSAGDDVALVSDAGTPTISDPGRLLVRAASERGIRVEPIPGPSAILTLLSASGFEGDTFTFLGFPPIRSKDRKTWFERLGTVGGVVVFFEAPHRIIETLHSIKEHFGDVDAVMGRELTKAYEQLVKGPISTLINAVQAPRGEYVVAIDIGHKTNISAVEPLGQDKWSTEIGRIANEQGISTRKAVNTLARRLGIPPNEVYAAAARNKKSG